MSKLLFLVMLSLCNYSFAKDTYKQSVDQMLYLLLNPEVVNKLNNKRITSIAYISNNTYQITAEDCSLIAALSIDTQKVFTVRSTPNIMVKISNYTCNKNIAN
ncbi:MAG: hypothetical protein JWM09_144 [Francisellaceae bacterium]|nr:hypothetical protein [Francisellaceae bacterium]